MRLGLRIKASEASEDIAALTLVGGRREDGPHPKFVFSSEMQKVEYDRLRKKMKGGEKIEGA